MCSLTGEGFIHSIEEETPLGEIVEREVENPSQTIHINIMTETKEIKEPKEETIFHVVNASG